MNKFKHLILICLFTQMVGSAQSSDKNRLAQVHRSITDFPELKFTEIPGAPKLSTPILITGNNGPLISQGFGLAAPAFYDWDGDGLKDLLIGEFGSGAEFGRYMGNFIRVYKNTGTEGHPEFASDFDYARPPFKILLNGTPYSVDQFCCMGFSPQFIDLNNDGFLDLFSGQYYGEIISFKGSSKGFLAGETLKQEGNPRDTVFRYFIRNQPYWLYSSAGFGDFTQDGKPDLIVGGKSLRISENVGTSDEPVFSSRKLLLDIHDQPLKVYHYTQTELATFEKKYVQSPFYKVIDFNPPYTSGDYELSPLVVDWDKDGILDLLVTNSYRNKKLSTVDFFRGVKLHGEHRFEPKVPLFSANGDKAFPGSHPFLFVTDWNRDGINDLLIGVSIVTIHNKINDAYTWTWEEDMDVPGTAKDPGFLMNRDSKVDLSQYLKNVVLPSSVSKEDYLTMRRQGYVYLMLADKK